MRYNTDGSQLAWDRLIIEIGLQNKSSGLPYKAIKIQKLYTKSF